MKLLFYAKERKDAGKHVWNLYQELSFDYDGEFFQSIDTLSQRFTQSLGDSVITLLLASSQEDFTDILSIKNLLKRTRIIIILPDRDKDTVRKGHTLFPRFLTYADSNFSWVTAVLKKMLSNNHTGNKSDNE